MEICIDEQDKIIEVWLTRSEANNMDIRNELQAKITECKRNKYLVCIYESGDRDLEDDIKALLNHNLHAAINTNNHEKKTAGNVW